MPWVACGLPTVAEDPRSPVGWSCCALGEDSSQRTQLPISIHFHFHSQGKIGTARSQRLWAWLSAGSSCPLISPELLLGWAGLGWAGVGPSQALRATARWGRGSGKVVASMDRVVELDCHCLSFRSQGHFVACSSDCCGLLDAVEADPGGGRGDGHGAGHTGTDRVLVLPSMPPLPDGRADLWTWGRVRPLNPRLGTGSLPWVATISSQGVWCTEFPEGGDVHIVNTIGLLFVGTIFSSEKIF
jgi:hypothetical protein